MTPTAVELLHLIDWPALRTATGSAGHVPQALAELFAASTEEEAKSAYWSHLDNEVVVQGQLFEAAKFVIGPVLAELAAGVVSDAARYRAVELMVEIALGQPHDSETPSVGRDLREECTKALRNGLWMFYALLDCQDERVVVGSLHVLEAVEEDQERLRGIARKLVARSESLAVKERVTELTSRL